MDITLYPDTWIRDLPLLNLEEGVYLSNRLTVGTNMCLLSGEIIVNQITIKKGALIGPFCGIGPGVTIGQGAEIGFGAKVGIGASIGKGTNIGMNSFVSHFARIGNNVKIGESCYIGKMARIADHIIIPSGLVIPDKASIKSQSDVDHRLINKGKFNATLNTSDERFPDTSEMLANGSRASSVNE